MDTRSIFLDTFTHFICASHTIFFSYEANGSLLCNGFFVGFPYRSYTWSLNCLRYGHNLVAKWDW